MRTAAAWETAVRTGKARADIRRATRAAVKAQYTGLGRQILTPLPQRRKRPSLKISQLRGDARQ